MRTTSSGQAASWDRNTRWRLQNHQHRQLHYCAVHHLLHAVTRHRQPGCGPLPAGAGAVRMRQDELRRERSLPGRRCCSGIRCAGSRQQLPPCLIPAMLGSTAQPQNSITRDISEVAEAALQCGDADSGRAQESCRALLVNACCLRALGTPVAQVHVLYQTLALFPQIAPTGGRTCPAHPPGLPASPWRSVGARPAPTAAPHPARPSRPATVNTLPLHFAQCVTPTYTTTVLQRKSGLASRILILMTDA